MKSLILWRNPMWSVFITGPAMLAIMGIVISLTGGTNFVVGAVTINVFQRRKGFKKGEGYFTRRANDEYYSVEFNKNSEYEICTDLGLIADIAPSLFNKFLKLKFDLTMSEEAYLGVLLVPVMEVATRFIEAIAAIKHQNTAETMAELLVVGDHFSKIVLPLARWFENFPTSRTKKK